MFADIHAFLIKSGHPIYSMLFLAIVLSSQWVEASTYNSRFRISFKTFSIKVAWSLQFLGYLRTLSLEFQQARLQAKLKSSCLCLFGRPSLTEISNLSSNTNETLGHTPLWFQNLVRHLDVQTKQKHQSRDHVRILNPGGLKKKVKYQW